MVLTHNKLQQITSSGEDYLFWRGGGGGGGGGATGRREPGSNVGVKSTGGKRRGLGWKLGYPQGLEPGEIGKSFETLCNNNN